MVMSPCGSAAFCTLLIRNYVDYYYLTSRTSNVKVVILARCEYITSNAITKRKRLYIMTLLAEDRNWIFLIPTRTQLGKVNLFFDRGSEYACGSIRRLRTTKRPRKEELKINRRTCNGLSSIDHASFHFLRQLLVVTKERLNT